MIKSKKITLDQYVFLLGIYIKQFYFLPSGNLQVGDVLMLVSAALTFLFRKKGKIKIVSNDYFFLAYFTFVVVINFIHSLIDGVSGYNRASLYYFFNTIIIILFSLNLQEENSKDFISGLFIIIKLSLLTQTILLISGIGKWYTRIRYEGSFNDPNQYGVFIFFCMLIVYMLGIELNKKRFPWVLLGVALILPSTSTGMMVGILAFFMSYLVIQLIETKDKRIIIWLIAIIILFFTYLGLSAGVLKLPSLVTSNRMYIRFFSKINRVFNAETEGSLLSDRGWARFVEHPQYLLYGAGEGNHERFNVRIEVHSSIIGPLFYYGFVPWLFLMTWIKRNLYRLDKKLICVYIGLFTESLFLINTRQPLYWIILILGSYKFSKRKI